MNHAESDPAAGGAPFDRAPAEQTPRADPEAAVTADQPRPGEPPPAQQPPGAGDEVPATDEQPPSRQMNPVLELVLILAAALGLWYVTNGWIVKPYRIPSASMEPTLQSGDRVLVNRFIYRFHDPRRGDIIVFHPPGVGDQAIPNSKHEASVYFIKRIIGLPGETVEGRSGHVLICKAPNVGCHILNEPYLTQRAAPTNFGPVRVPQGRYFMMGDNRAISDDSRDWGTLPRSYIIGEAFATYWPLNRLRTL
jgi:signal peptidase I